MHFLHYAQHFTCCFLFDLSVSLIGITVIIIDSARTAVPGSAIITFGVQKVLSHDPVDLLEILQNLLPWVDLVMGGNSVKA